MVTSDRLQRLGRSVLEVIIYLLVLVLGVVLIGRLAGWRSPSQYADALVWAALLPLLAAGASAAGLGSRRRSPYRYGQTLAEHNPADELQRELREAFRGYGFTIQMVVTGLLCFGVAILASSLAG